MFYRLCGGGSPGIEKSMLFLPTDKLSNV